MKIEEICKQLGMNPSIGFVTVRNGLVGFSVGKPDEVMLLKRRCAAAGIPMTKKLREFHRGK